jgi:hypothetical protein
MTSESRRGKDFSRTGRSPWQTGESDPYIS